MESRRMEQLMRRLGMRRRRKTETGTDATQETSRETMIARDDAWRQLLQHIQTLFSYYHLLLAMKAASGVVVAVVTEVLLLVVDLIVLTIVVVVVVVVVV